MSKDIENIDVLINAILNEIEKGRLKLKNAMENQKTVSYWNIGKHINNHLLLHSDKAKYGDYLFPKLSETLNIGKRSLYLAVQFYKSYKNINSYLDHLTWSHFKILLTIKSDERRLYYEKLLLSKNISIRDFYTMVKKDQNNLITYIGDNLTIFEGIPYIYKFKIKDDKAYLDLGFHFYSDLFSDKYSKFNNDDIVQVIKNKTNYTFKQTDYDSTALYTYKASIVKIIDGDTIKVNIDLGFNTITAQVLRFRGINAFDLNTKAGKKAKSYVLSKLENNKTILVKTYKPDKYSRFLADIYYADNNDNFIPTTNSLSFLNQELLDNNHAVKYYIY